MAAAYIFGSVILVSLISVLAALPLLVTKRAPKTMLLGLLSLSVGSLLGSVFIHFLPESVSHGYTLGLALLVLAGFFVFFIIEKFVHNHHSGKLDQGHHHAYHLAPLNLIGEAVHNFIDGLVIAASYLVSIPLGIAATVSVISHELPQEIADFGILLYSGLSKKKALVYNFLAALTALIGAGLGLLLQSVHGFTQAVLPFAAGGFLYIASANLVPELHKEHNARQTLFQLGMAALGIAIMVLLALYGPAHTHG